MGQRPGQAGYECGIVVGSRKRRARTAHRQVLRLVRRRPRSHPRQLTRPEQAEAIQPPTKGPLEASAVGGADRAVSAVLVH
jgi:hypothetical protein